MNEQILRATKEIIVKFIESGRISPSGFGESFKDVYNTIHETVVDDTKIEVVQENQQPKKNKQQGKKNR